jgi:hypothetical protein
MRIIMHSLAPVLWLVVREFIIRENLTELTLVKNCDDNGVCACPRLAGALADEREGGVVSTHMRADKILGDEWRIHGLRGTSDFTRAWWQVFT